MNDTLLKKLRDDTRRYGVAVIVPAAASLASVSIFTRIFDTVDYGRYSLTLAVVAIATVPFAGWIRQSTLRYLPRFKAEHSLASLNRGVLRILGASCVLVAGLSAAAYWAVHSALGEYGGMYWPAVALLLAEMVFLSLNTVFWADLKARRFATFKIACSALRLTFALAFVFFIKKDVIGLIAGAALAQIILIFPMVRSLALGGREDLAVVAFDSGMWRKFARYGLPMVGWVLGGQILRVSDRFIIGAFRGSSEVGVYAANYDLVSTGFGLVTAPLLMAAYPLIMTAWEKNRRQQEISSVITSFSRLYIITALPFVMLITVFSLEISTLLLGAAFRDGHTIIPLVLAGASVWGLSMFGHKGLELQEKTTMLLGLVILSATTNVVLNLLFVPEYGYKAAAVTTFVSYLTYPVLVYVITNRSDLRWRIPWCTIVRTVAASLITGGVLWLAKIALPVEAPIVLVLISGGVAGIGLYVWLLVLFKEIRREELNLLLSSE